MNGFYKNTNKYLHKRLWIIFAGILGLFLILIIKLYNLQIIQGEFLQNQVVGTVLKEIDIAAPRGNIYDRLGRPLATNDASFTVNFDQSENIENINEVILKTINLIEKNNDSMVDEFPIAKEKDFYFLLGDNKTKEKNWKKELGLDETLSAKEAFLALRKKFSVDESLSDEDARKILIGRTELYKKRYSRFIPITIAYDVSQETIGAIEENKEDFRGVYIDVEATRKYPKGKLFSHILGYIRGITETELKEYLNYGYTQSDIIGKEGIEKAFELNLKGKDGKAYYEVDNLGRKFKEDETKSIDPIAGNDVFLTVDAKLQEVAYNALETALKDTIINRLMGKSKEVNYTAKDLLISMIESNNISVKKILNAKDGAQAVIKEKILSKNQDAQNDYEQAKDLLINAVLKGEVYQSQILLTIVEQGLVSADEKYISRIKSGSVSSLQFIIDKLNSGELTPHMTAMDPSTGSVVVTDVNTGDVLASVSYPSYDNNSFVNNFDNEYYISLQNDPTTPLVNRPFTEPRAPGSTFKMITAVAGLEEGVITPNSTTYDKGIFKEAGSPYARCWIYSSTRNAGSHGSVDVSHALEVSCNYFFYDLSYRLGNNAKSNIEILNKYMEYFGLDEKTGVEIYELYNSTSSYPKNISSPKYKEYITKLRNPNASSSEIKWTEGDTIRTSIGQSYNNYTVATLAKYVATLANGGDRYALHFLKDIKNSDGKTISAYEPKLEKKLNLKQSTIDAVHKGMLLVTSGSRGTFRTAFRDFPVKVAAKSGTAQQSSLRSNHAVFVGFMPYENPQIAIAISIPYGNDTTQPAPTIAKKIIEEYLGLNDQPEKQQFDTLTK